MNLLRNNTKIHIAMEKDSEKIDWGKMTRNIQYKGAPATAKNQVPKPQGWVKDNTETHIKSNLTTFNNL